MSFGHLHLMTNHFPVIGIFIGFALVASAMFWKSADLKRFSLWYFVLLGLITLVAYFTGEPAEDAVENVTGVAKQVIEQHEDAAMFALIGIELIAVLSLAGLMKSSLAAKTWFFRTLLILVLWASTVLARVAYLGGQIRHTEFSPSAPAETK